MATSRDDDGNQFEQNGGHMRWQRSFTVFLLVFCLSWAGMYGSEQSASGQPSEAAPVETMSDEELNSELMTIFSWFDEALMTQGLTWNELLQLSPTVQTDMQKSETKLTELEQSFQSYKGASESRITQLESDLEQARRWNWPVFFKGIGVGAIIGLIGSSAVYFAAGKGD